MDTYLEVWRDSWPALLDGAKTTLVITAFGSALALAVGVLAGTVTAFKAPVLNTVVRGYVEIVRGTPLIVQIFFLFFGLPVVTGTAIDATTVGIAAVGVHHGAYFSEIVRGAIKSVPLAQFESSRSLGMSWWLSLRDVIAPQALLQAFPSLGNQLVICLKDTSLLAVIGVSEVTRQGQIIIANTFQAFEVWLLVAVLYLLMTSVLSFAVRRSERTLGRFLPESTRQ
ncbi:amino acid ABC transporter permease [Streptomyces sp. NPDC052042]|uniref:amino acid ABC transporter permease n=1 Tax=Streptomyces sp. NPDC052042 TaxID=3365683 RepID=UPI0037D068EF